MNKTCAILKERLRKIDKNYLFIFVACLFMLLPYISRSYNGGHDTYYHLTSISGMSSLNIVDIFKEKIFSFFDRDLGYGFGLFYPQLSHIIPLLILKLFGIFRLGIISSIKISKFIVLYISGAGMYKLVKLVTSNRKSALVSSILYVTLPYLLFDIYVRDAMAEIYIFVFMPILFISLYYMLNDNLRGFILYFVLGLVGLINSHLVLTMYLGLYMVVACIINFKQIFKCKNIMMIIIGIVISLLICSPFLMPLLEHRIEGNYNVFQPNFMASWGMLKENRIYLYELFWKIENPDLFFINNIFSWLILFVTIFRYKKFRTKDNSFYIKSAFTFVVLSTVLSSKLINWEYMPEIFRMIQFPWRLISFLSFGLCLLVGVVFEKLDFSFISKDLLLFVILFSCFIYGIMPSKRITLIDDYINKIGGEPRFDTSQVLEYGWFAEYLPVEVSKNYEYALNRENDIVVVSGKVSVNDFVNTIPDMSFNATNVNKAKLEIPAFYYLGYTIYADYGQGNIEKIPYYKNNHGFIEFDLAKDAQIKIEYTGTTLDNICNIVSPIIIVGFVIYAFVSSKKLKPNT